MPTHEGRYASHEETATIDHCLGRRLSAERTCRLRLRQTHYII